MCVTLAKTLALRKPWKGETGSGSPWVLLTGSGRASALASRFPKWGNGLMSGLVFLKLTVTLSWTQSQSFVSQWSAFRMKGSELSLLPQ